MPRCWTGSAVGARSSRYCSSSTSVGGQPARSGPRLQLRAWALRASPSVARQVLGSGLRRASSRRIAASPRPGLLVEGARSLCRRVDSLQSHALPVAYAGAVMSQNRDITAESRCGSVSFRRHRICGARVVFPMATCVGVLASKFFTTSSDDYFAVAVGTC
jgi:hypothetical protein